MLVLLVLLSVVAGSPTPTDKPAAATSKVAQCFYGGSWYKAGTIISAGRSFDWCYGSYCDNNGVVQYWDDFSCPNSGDTKTKSPFSSLSSSTSTPSPATVEASRTQLAPSAITFGCSYQGRRYQPGEDIFKKKRGRYCFGAYCDWLSKIQTWDMLCEQITPPTTVDLT